MNVIYKTSPLHTAENVPLDKVIEIYFMIDVNKQTLNDQTVILFNFDDRRAEEIKIDYRNRVLKVEPVHLLNPKGHYQFQIVGGQNGIKDITGRVMAETYEVEFQTIDRKEIKPPVILTPTNLSVIQEALSFQLREAEYADHYNLQISKSNTFHNLVWPADREEKIYDLSVTPYLEIDEGQYYARARSVNKEGQYSSWSDIVQFYVEPITVKEEMPGANNDSNGIRLECSTKAKEEGELDQLQDLLEKEETETPSNIVSVSVTPKDKSLNNNLVKSKTIEIVFSEPINPDSISSSSCYVLMESN